MDAFNYLSVLVSIIIGLGLTRLVEDLSRMFKHSSMDTFFFVQLAWVLFTLALHIQYWWAFWDYRKVKVWTYPKFLLLLSGPVVLYFAASCASHIESDGDWKTPFIKNHLRYFLALSLYLLFMTISASVLRAEGRLWQGSNIPRIIACVLAFCAAWSNSVLLHVIFPLMGLGLLVFFLARFNSEPLIVRDASIDSLD